jgi:two-component system sensor histidine kinase/response regulator
MRVLVAEDEPALLEAYCEVVAGLGHEVIRAVDGDEAIAVARTKHPDLVVTDYMMPGRTGAEVARALHVDPILMRVPVIMVSAARPPSQDKSEAFAFLQKPVSVDELEAAIAKGLAAAKAAGSPVGFRAEPPPDVPSEVRAREEMLNWVAHEFKSPLSAAMAAAQLATRGLHHNEPSQLVEQRLRSILRQLARMNELVNTLLDAAQLQDGKLQIERHVVDVSKTVREAIAYWADLHPDVSMEIRADGIIEVEADGARLRQILDNLLTNAIKYGRPANRVEVEVDVTDGHVQIAVIDHGPGIAKDDIPHLFDRFHRVSGQAGRGHGLGLYIAAALARQHGGTLDVESRLGDGSTFTLRLPRKT